MAILNIQTSEAGLSGVTPKVIYLDTTDSISMVTTPGYLNKIIAQNIPLCDKDMALVSTVDNKKKDSSWYRVVFSDGSWSLTAVDTNIKLTSDLNDPHPEEALSGDTILNNAPAKGVLVSGSDPIIGNLDRGNPQWVTQMNNGSVLIGNSLGAPQPGQITSTGLDVVTGPNTLELNVNGETNAPAIFVRAVNFQSIPSGVETALIWDDVVFNRGFSFVSGTNFTVPEDGIYNLSYAASFEGNSNGIRGIYVQAASSNYGASERFALEQSSLVGGVTTSFSGSAIFNLNSGDSLVVECFQDSGVNLNISSNLEPNYSNLQLIKVSSLI